MKTEPLGSAAQPALMDPATNECPFDWYARLRNEAPVHRDAASGIYVVTRYDLVIEALRDPQRFSNAVDQASLRPGGLPAAAKEILATGVRAVSTLASCDPPAHTRYRALVNRAFTASRVRGMAPYIERIIEQLIDGFVRDGEVELVSRFAVPLPTYVIADQLGVPRSDLAQFKSWSDAVVGLHGLLADEETVIDYARRIAELQRYLLARAEERRHAPKDDMLTDLVAARIEGERPLDDYELISILQQLLVAGNETTTSALAAGMQMLVADRDLAARIAADPANNLKTFVEEVLRLESPVQGSLRRATSDTKLGGVDIPKGALIQLRFGAANRDENIFEHGAAADIRRRNAGAHLAFGAGIHFCIGAMLARQELVSGLSALLRRLRNVRFAPGANDFRHHPSFYLRGLKALHFVFDPA